MLKNVLFISLAVVIAVGLVCAQQSPPNSVVVPVGNAPANDGKQMYVSFCAPCHGVNGKGQGPVAGELKQQPTNLTLLSKENGGKFPANHIVLVLKFGTATPAHGTAAMPVWGPMFGSMKSPNISQPDDSGLRISNLNQYLESLQVK